MSSSNTTMKPEAELPNEVVADILVRLPSKSLLRFKRVSKQWLKLITSRCFALRHLSIAKDRNFTSFFIASEKNFITPVSVGLDHSVRIDPSIDLPCDVFRTPVLVSAGFGIYCVFGNFSGALQLWNPTTRECIGLPPPPREYEGYHCFYFGKVDCKDGDFSYKVGQVTTMEKVLGYSGTLLSQSLELYSSKTKAWTVIPNVIWGEIYCHGDGACVNLNGKAHWITYCEVFDLSSTIITTFDYENEALGWIPFQLAPDVGHYDESKSILSVWDEAYLCLVLFCEKDDSLFLDVWVMRQYGLEDSWIKEFTVGPISRGAKVFGFSSKVQGIFFREAGSCSTSLKLYDCRSASIKEFSLLSEHIDQYLQIKEHVESLISVSM